MTVISFVVIIVVWKKLPHTVTGSFFFLFYFCTFLVVMIFNHKAMGFINSAGTVINLQVVTNDQRSGIFLCEFFLLKRKIFPHCVCFLTFELKRDTQRGKKLIKNKKNRRRMGRYDMIKWIWITHRRWERLADGVTWHPNMNVGDKFKTHLFSVSYT